MEMVTAIRFIADQMPQPDAYLGGGMTVVGQHEDAARVLAADTDQVGDAVHQNARLARTRSCQDQHAGLFTIVRDDLLLHRIVQRLDDGLP